MTTRPESQNGRSRQSEEGRKSMNDATSAGGHRRAEQKAALLRIVEDFGLEERPAAIRLASGGESKFFVDAKQALSNGRHLRVACEFVIALAAEIAPDWNAVGGMTLGADPLAHGIALLTGRNWFTVRQERKGRGSNKLIEAVSLSIDNRVLLIDDVVTTGGSISRAFTAVRDGGAAVVFATALVDRGRSTQTFFDQHRVPYRPLLTYEDLRIPPIDDEISSSTAS